MKTKNKQSYIGSFRLCKPIHNCYYIEFKENEKHSY